eukprot:TRINITY_DN1925_c0_g1_i1.p1 TRINITY_DN1925_c0_g1~~TRINITY_DN1925_c0_g1_i1.p1  ORF type:complete len:1014 (+),score=171.36 TRINITY_DN1925_c0_g1_i1:36-3077(+)
MGEPSIFTSCCCLGAQNTDDLPASSMSVSVDRIPSQSSVQLSTVQELCLARGEEDIFQLVAALLRKRPRIAKRLERECLLQVQEARERSLEQKPREVEEQVPMSQDDGSFLEREPSAPTAGIVVTAFSDHISDQADKPNTGRLLSVEPVKPATVVACPRKSAHQRASLAAKPEKHVMGFLCGQQQETRISNMIARMSVYPAPMLNSIIFRMCLVTSVVIALFGGNVATLANLPDDPGLVVIDTIMILVTVIFVLELVLNCIVNWKFYPLSFFFWMDLVGTVSMILEISFLLGTAGQMTDASSPVDTVVMRAARAAKVGARAGRLSKLLKYFEKTAYQVEDGVEAKVLARKLILVVSTRVSMLTIVLVMVIPLFQIGEFPEVDLAMDTWANSLEAGYKSAYDAQMAQHAFNSTDFEVKVSDMIRFYTSGSKDGKRSYKYEPFKLQGWDTEVTTNSMSMTIQGQELLQKPFPPRLSNVMLTEVQECLVNRPACSSSNQSKKVGIYWDLQAARQQEALLDIGLIAFVTTSMVAISIILSFTLDKLVIQPLERMLTNVMQMAGNILQQFGVDPGVDGDVEETTLIEGIFKRFARLAALAAERKELTEEQLEGMDAATRGVMLEIFDVKKDVLGSEAKVDAESSVPLEAISKLSVDPSVIDSWNFDVLAYEPAENTQVAIHLFFDTRLGQNTGRKWTAPATFVKFHSEVQSSYNDLPYHNYAHAIDVLHTVYRLLTITASSAWVSSVEQYALLIAALCHDLGHQGKTNQFLVEVKHQWALTYNDKSPLENMHAAKLFVICSKGSHDIFANLDEEGKKLARKVCIATILHTDNVNHFDMIRDISKTYEIMSDVCEDQAACSEEEILSSYEEQVLKKNSMQWLELFLHFSDVSNPLKPFHICRAWAWRVLEEFFDQGDEEKELGIPVGMLNDRTKINRPGSQHGFINFMVAPLVFSTVQLFPSLHPVYSQMAENLESWRQLWVEDAKPSPEEIAKKDADVRKIKNNALMLSSRSTATSGQ